MTKSHILQIMLIEENTVDRLELLPRNKMHKNKSQFMWATVPCSLCLNLLSEDMGVAVSPFAVIVLYDADVLKQWPIYCNPYFKWL